MPAEIHAPAEDVAYAVELYRYARGHLDAHALRAWMIQRLMLDLALDHDAAARMADRAIVDGRAASLHERHIIRSRPFIRMPRRPQATRRRRPALR